MLRFEQGKRDFGPDQRTLAIDGQFKRDSRYPDQGGTLGWTSMTTRVKPFSPWDLMTSVRVSFTFKANSFAASWLTRGADNGVAG